MPRIWFAALILFGYAVSGHAYMLTEEQSKHMAISTPQPEYPFEARLHWIEGQGFFILRVQIRTGLVKSVIVQRSTGSQLLDSSAVAGLKRWRFRPGALPPISVELPKRKDALAKEDSFIGVPVNFIMKR